MNIGRLGGSSGDHRDGLPDIQSIPYGAIWSAFTSEYGVFTAELESSGTPADVASPTDLPIMPTTAVVTVPISTVTVQSTILQTAFVTVTSGLVQPYSSSSSALISTYSSSTSKISTSQPSAPQSTLSLPWPSSTGFSASIVPVVTQSSSAASSTTSITESLDYIRPTTTAPTAISTGASTVAPTAASTAALATAPASATVGAKQVSQKHAVVGGLTGAIAGFVLIGALLFFCFRKRRRRQDDERDAHHEIHNEKGLRPTMKRKWTEMTGRGTPTPTPQLPPSTSPVTVDEEHHIIRMSTQHWARPYALGQGEGYRESVGPGQLRVMNPDAARPETPRMSSDTAGSFLGRLQHLGPSRPTTPRSDTASSFLKKQRSALAAVLLTANRSRASSRSNIHTHDPTPHIPEIIFDPALSRECIAPSARPPSFRSYLSATSLPIVQQSPPEDPFLTPPNEKDEEASSPPRQRPTRPTLAPLQSAAGAATRTLSHLGSAMLNPFRTRSVVETTTVARSPSSVSTWSSRRNTGFSDPFDLDKPSVRGSTAAHVTSDLERGRTLYEGT
ncbi:hypothetical protein LTR91_001649 [Friedmanniomyces endolithicus]|uniref:Uncharacterized protein n=1 Tax=Friedmanniomyces endolithicus TaxID=329885 RepID=A0AAN6L2B7_9PEZI|nr:hypothetical protein LTR35_003824 [Friedmanniomyces endolithicus]KAK0300357.1 hypothetical protein LTS00_001429 [Friedmanniomyces endolithicus]KAK0314861.1 hypothetical protein LTR01_001685 [Friedmanniomyces endolithicus]KAK0324841.1 hypothetical protein LTR82_003827 [Friedmanniomyces endolithicus]KAK0831109.1 hypothetical protein LTR73_003496 [Friedmanniomyces endolithicus]